MQTLRTTERTKTSLKAKILVGNGGATMPCLVTDLSDTGAKIQVDGAHVLPSEFDLEIAGTGKIRAEVRWRYVHMVGLKFVGQDAQAPEFPTRDALIVENRKLWDALESMAKRLTQLGELVVLPPDLMNAASASKERSNGTAEGTRQPQTSELTAFL